MFLQSSYVPTYLVSAFIKRMARIALFSPPSGILFILPFIYNLFRIHPSCLKLIHRLDQENFVGINRYNVDPFIFECMDPSSCCAKDSSLWELEILKKHYYPKVSAMAIIFAESLAKPSYDLEDFFDHSYKSLMEIELSSKKSLAPKTTTTTIFSELFR
jgi:U3 small nucleolar RNA-associated protein 19